MSLNPIIKMVEEKVAEAAAPAITEVTTKAAELIAPVIGQRKQSDDNLFLTSLYHQAGVYDAREGFAPRTDLQEKPMASYLTGYNAEKEKMRAEKAKEKIIQSIQRFIDIFSAAAGLSAGLYIVFRIWPKPVQK